jgi:hypothetical protein
VARDQEPGVGRVPPVAALLAALVCGFFVYYPITDTDIWWHLAAGREILRQGAFLHADPFSFTPTVAWVDVHWLFQVGAYAAWLAGGAGLLVAVKSFLVALTGVALFYALPAQRLPWLTGGTIALLVYASRYLIAERPIVVTLLLVAAFLLLLERYRASGKARYLWLLLPLQALWANVQGLFVLGLVLFGAYAAGMIVERVRSRSSTQRGRLFLLVGAGLLAACLATPYGLQGLAFPLRLLSRIEPVSGNLYSANVSENAPLLSMLATEPGYVWVVLLVGLVGLGLFALSLKRLRVEHLLLFVAFLALAFMAQRNVVLFLFVAAPLVAFHTGECFRHWRERSASSRWLRGVGLAAAVLVAALLTRGVVEHCLMLGVCPKHSSLSPFRHPVEATELLRQHPVRGNIFNSDRYGGWLLWQLYPPKQVFIDGRFMVRPPSFFAEYLGVLDEPARFESVAAKYGITHVLLQTAIFGRALPLARRLYGEEGWRLVYADGASALFEADSVATLPGVDLSDSVAVDSTLGALDAHWHDDPYIRLEARQHFADFLVLMGEEQSAWRVGGSRVRGVGEMRWR